MEHPGRGIDFQKNVEIDGTTYKVFLYSPSKGVRVLAKLMKLLGEPMAMMAGAQRSEGAVFDLLPKAARSLVERMDEDEVVGLIKELCNTCQRDRKPIEFEIEFQGRLGTMAKLVAKVVEIQFEDFFKALSDSFHDLGAEEAGKA